MKTRTLTGRGQGEACVFLTTELIFNRALLLLQLNAALWKRPFRTRSAQELFVPPCQEILWFKSQSWPSVLERKNVTKVHLFCCCWTQAPHPRFLVRLRLWSVSFLFLPGHRQASRGRRRADAGLPTGPEWRQMGCSAQRSRRDSWKEKRMSNRRCWSSCEWQSAPSCAACLAGRTVAAAPVPVWQQPGLWNTGGKYCNGTADVWKSMRSSVCALPSGFTATFWVV